MQVKGYRKIKLNRWTSSFRRRWIFWSSGNDVDVGDKQIGKNVGEHCVVFKPFNSQIMDAVVAIIHKVRKLCCI